jgi:DNA-binding MarR family transcriptional regulator
VPTPIETATAFGELFPAVYLRFHRRDGKAPQLAGASRAVLLHLQGAGPLTIGELALHLERAQSATSEIVDHLERDGLLERLRDPADRRRVLVWLTDAGLEHLARDRDVLSRELLATAMNQMTSDERDALLAGMRALLRALPPPGDSDE